MCIQFCVRLVLKEALSLRGVRVVSGEVSNVKLMLKHVNDIIRISSDLMNNFGTPVAYAKCVSPPEVSTVKISLIMISLSLDQGITVDMV